MAPMHAHVPMFVPIAANGLHPQPHVYHTSSNGKPRVPSSLHYIDPSGRLNYYQQANLGVGEVIQFYDSDRRFLAWGFGAKLPDGLVSHCFNLNGNHNSYEFAERNDYSIKEIDEIRGELAKFIMDIVNEDNMY